MNLTFVLLQAPLGGPNLILLLFIIIILFYLFSNRLDRIGNWSHLYGNMQYEPETFYAQVEEILNAHEVPAFKTDRLTFKEGGFISHQRLYLEVSSGDYIFHICAAPWGTDFFFSWWLNSRTNNFQLLLTKIPIIKQAVAYANREETYYRLDTDTMFRTSVQQAVLSAIEKLTEAKGIKALTELERKPDLRSFIK